MNRLKIRLISTSPSSFLSSRAVPNVEKSLDYIPGSTLRGALAKEWLKIDKPNETFENLFTKGLILFNNLYKEKAKPIPLSALSCKYQPGFHSDSIGNRDDKTHGVRDILLPLIREKENAVKLPLNCQECEHNFPDLEEKCSAPMKKYRGYYSDSFKTVSVSKRLIYHTAISSIFESAAESNLYSLEIIEETQDFEGEILIFDDSLSDKIDGIINDLSHLLLGSDKSRGHGHFEIGNHTITNNQNKISDIQSRIDKFNNKLGLNNGNTYFSITLQSDAIIIDHFMRYKTVIESYDIGIENIVLLFCIADNQIISGWNSLLQLPKEDVIAIIKGSVFVFKIKNFDENTVKILYKLENEGIGKRKAEGFGRLKVCDPFHWSGAEVK